jgi:TM2 domain-containing membrane protein YozV
MVEWILNPTKPVTKGMAVLILILNIFISGVGTMVYGRVLRGVLELVGLLIIIGWIFSVIDGIMVVRKAPTTTPAQTTPTSG